MKDLGDEFNFQSASIIHSGTSFFRNDVCFFLNGLEDPWLSFSFDLNELFEKLKS